MSFSVFGVNTVKCRDAAIKYIKGTEGKSIAVLRYEADLGGDLGKHFENLINKIDDKDQYEKALKERFNSLCKSAKWSAISKKFDAPQSAIDYLKMLNSKGGKGMIKQQCGVVDGEGKPVLSKTGSNQKLEWRDFDVQTMRVKPR